MNTVRLAFKVVNVFLLSFIWFFPSHTANAVDGTYTLEQVVVFSRHGLRVPLVSPTKTSYLGKLTPYDWPQLTSVPGYLSLRGSILESYFGHYFNEWLTENGLLKAGVCPNPDAVNIYTNSFQRTIATGEYFTVGAFPGCRVPVNHKGKFNTSDPTFGFNMTNTTVAFQQEAIKSIHKKAGNGGVEGFNQRFDNTYRLLARVLNYNQSADCKHLKHCNFLSSYETKITIDAGRPVLAGPLTIATAVADAFILQYYEGIPLEKVAWGQLKNENELSSLVKLKDNYINIVYGSSTMAREMAHRLVNYIYGVFTNAQGNAKFTLIVGHDANIASLFSSLGVRAYRLEGQLETIPIGGKVVFSKWRNQIGKMFIKLEYVYQSTEQIRNQLPLTKENPPKRVTLTLQGCEHDERGFCRYDDFLKILNSAKTSVMSH